MKHPFTTTPDIYEFFATPRLQGLLKFIKIKTIKTRKNI